ncbi:MAG: cephalosporin hydroxylase [Alphaproteobacteria bacterium]|nr:cephalosporin hydroxylase [Alphaproteobacteria bacterium]
MSDARSFLDARVVSIEKLATNKQLRNTSLSFIKDCGALGYQYNFDWLGVPIIQVPQDIVAIQEIIWKTKPDVIIETGVARGGSLIFSASILHLLNGNGKVIGIDIDIRDHNRAAIENHSLAFRINLIQGSSIESSTIEQVNNFIKAEDRVMVILDSNHTHEHVLKELNLYSPLVTKDCYLVVMDTLVDDMPDDYFKDRPWGKNNNPKTAVHEFLKSVDRFEIDESMHNKLLITVAPDGYLKCVK